MVRNLRRTQSIPLTSSSGLSVRLNLGALDSLPDFSAAPREREPAALLEKLRDAGFDGVQGGPEWVEPARKLGMPVSGSARVDAVKEAAEVARRMSSAGIDATTLHVGSGFESDAEIDLLVGAILEASARFDHPMYIETHRATITQDCWRTIQITARHPDVRFNGDFSHWYTGQELIYGDLDTKLARLAPVFERVSFLHGRIGNPGCIQVPVEEDADGESGQIFVGHFRRMWTTVFREFLRRAKPNEVIVFAPELLPAKYYYARTFEGREESDRWTQGLLLARIARECFKAAQQPSA